MHALEEKVRMLQTNRDEMTSHATSQSHTVSELQTKNANLNIENEALKRKVENLQQVC